MNAFPVPFRVVAAALLTAFLVTIGILNLRDRASFAEPSDGVFWEESARGLRASEVLPEGPGARAGIRSGDLLLSINGTAIQNLGQYSDILDRLGINAAGVYLVATGSEQRDLSLQLTAHVVFTSRDALRTVLAFLYLGIGVFVVLRNGQMRRSFHFYLVCVAAFVVYLYSYTTKLDALDWSVYCLSVAAFLLLPALFVHFCLRFPVEPVAARSRSLLIYFPALVLGMVHILWMAGRLADFGLPRTAGSSQILDRIQLGYFCIGLLAGGAILFRKRATSSDLTARQQMKWVGYGTIAGVLPFGLIYVIPTLLGVRAGFAMEASMLSLGLIPLSFAYAVVHYRLLDVEVIVRKGAAYFLASSLLLTMYLLFVLVLGRGLQWIVPQANFLVICLAALTIALLFAPLRTRIQARLDRLFYREQFDDRASLMEFARTLSSEISLAPLSRNILERISKTFQLEPVVLFLADAMHPGFFRLADALLIEIPPSYPLCRQEELLEADDAASPDETGLEGRLHRASPALRKMELHYFQDLNLRGRRIGLIGLGRLPQGRHFSSEDLDLLKALAGYAAIALENATLYRSVETKALELERLKNYTENIIESINVAVVALDLDGRISSCNRAFEELYEVQRDRIRGLPVESLVTEDVVAAIRKVTGAAGWDIKSGANLFKLYLENPRGRKLIVNLSVIPLIDHTDLNSGCLIVMDDVTEKVHLEDQIMQVEKLSSIGLLAAGIAHEVNTPITGISSYTQMLLKDTPESDVRKPILEKIEKQTFRAAEIVNGLLNFARMNGSEFTDLDLNQLIRESLALLEHQLRQNHIKVETSLDEKIPQVFGNSGKLQQVFINLFLNARDAMASGGELRVRTAMNEKMVVVDIEDTGVGISDENIKRIYDPFFTTKTTGKGTGLGLAVTYGIIQEHGGRIFVDSVPSHGTHFRLKLPTRQLPNR